MPGAPKKRALKEQEARKRLEVLATAQAEERALAMPRKGVKYSRELGQEIAALIASGVPVVDSTINGAVVSPGVATRMGIHPATVYEWQQRYPDFAESMARARQESADRVADRMLALADVALAEPAMANSVRVAADILRWQAGVRGPNTYGERRRIDVSARDGDEWGERLRRAWDRVKAEASQREARIEAEVQAEVQRRLARTQAVDAEIVAALPAPSDPAPADVPPPPGCVLEEEGE